MEVFATGLAMGESPRWHDEGDGARLWVCDWLAGEVLSFDAAGVRRVEQRVAGLPFSLDWLPDGRRLLASATGVIDRGGSAYAGSGRGWNEIVVHPSGNAYVNEVGFDLMGGEEPTTGSLWVARPDGTSDRVADELWFPNGMAVSACGLTLLVAESYAHRLSAFDVAGDGTLSGRRVWAELDGGTPDGICLDAEGACWYADVPGRCCVRVAEGGQVLDRVEAEDGCFACMLGGEDGRTLYVVTMPWGGTSAMAGAERTGRILTHRAPAPHAGHP